MHSHAVEKGAKRPALLCRASVLRDSAVGAVLLLGKDEPVASGGRVAEERGHGRVSAGIRLRHSRTPYSARGGTPLSFL